MNGHKKESIFKNRNALSPDYIPKVLPNRMKHVEKLGRQIQKFLDGHTTHVLISGRPGTGKSATIRYVFREMKENKKPLFSYVNCFNKTTKMGVLYSIVLDFFKEKRPTRKMPSRRGIAYDEMLDSLKKELEKSSTKVVLCLDEVDQLREKDLIYDLLRIRWNSNCIQVIGISNNPLVFKDLDPRTKSRLYPLKEIPFNPYSKNEMREIIQERTDEAFGEGNVDNEAINFLADFTVRKKGDVRVARETLIRAAEYAGKSGQNRLTLNHLKEKLKMTEHAKAISVIRNISEREKFLLKMIPEKGITYPKFYKIFRELDGGIGDRMLRNYMERLHKLNLINMEQTGVGGRQIISLNTPKEVLFGLS